jgi:hypothetical protein
MYPVPPELVWILRKCQPRPSPVVTLGICTFNIFGRNSLLRLLAGEMVTASCWVSGRNRFPTNDRCPCPSPAASPHIRKLGPTKKHNTGSCVQVYTTSSPSRSKGLQTHAEVLECVSARFPHFISGNIITTVRMFECLKCLV